MFSRCLSCKYTSLKRRDLNTLAELLDINPLQFKNKEMLQAEINKVFKNIENKTDFATLEPIEKVSNIVVWTQNEKLYAACADSLATMFQYNNFINPYTIDYASGYQIGDTNYALKYDLRNVSGLLEKVANRCNAIYESDPRAPEYIKLTQKCDQYFDKLKTNVVSAQGQYMYTDHIINKMFVMTKGDACILFAMAIRHLLLELQRMGNEEFAISVLEQLYVGVRTEMTKNTSYFAVHGLIYFLEEIYLVLPESTAGSVTLHMIDKISSLLS